MTDYTIEILNRLSRAVEYKIVGNRFYRRPKGLLSFWESHPSEFDDLQIYLKKRCEAEEVSILWRKTSQVKATFTEHRTLRGAGLEHARIYNFSSVNNIGVNMHMAFNCHRVCEFEGNILLVLAGTTIIRETFEKREDLMIRVDKLLAIQGQRTKRKRLLTGLGVYQRYNYGSP